MLGLEISNIILNRKSFPCFRVQKKVTKRLGGKKKIRKGLHVLHVQQFKLSSFLPFSTSIRLDFPELINFGITKYIDNRGKGKEGKRKSDEHGKYAMRTTWRSAQSANFLFDTSQYYGSRVFPFPCFSLFHTSLSLSCGSARCARAEDGRWITGHNENADSPNSFLFKTGERSDFPGIFVCSCIHCFNSVFIPVSCPDARSSGIFFPPSLKTLIFC